ncbi:MAG: cytochrome-c peroxidase [Bacteroidota bacterium]
MSKNSLVFLSCMLLFISWIQTGSALLCEELISRGWPPPRVDINRLNSDEIQLGRLLFYDPILSRDSSISCASCHSPYNAFAHSDHALSHGIGDSIGFRNAPALQLLAWQNRFMWDGRFGSLQEQILFPITHAGEMGEDTAQLLLKLNREGRYAQAGMKAFGDSLITIQRMQSAIAQFLLTLVPHESRYDSVMRRQQTFSEQEQHGYALFRLHCNSCHTEPLFSDFSFERNGLSPDPVLQDQGRMTVTNMTGDRLRFKVPSLRNLSYSAPYMHDGRFRSLRQVLSHYMQVSGSQDLRASRL